MSGDTNARAAAARLVDGFGAERFRLRLARRAEALAVKVDLVRPLAAHAPDLLMSVGPGLLVPLGQISPLIEALDAVRREAMEGAAASDACGTERGAR